MHSLDENHVGDDPMPLLAKWMDDAIKSKHPEPTAMILSTVGKNGQPSSRVVLLKKLEDRQLIFFTNYNSRKASDIRNHASVSALFFWPELERQVKICGVAKEIDPRDSEKYFQSRPLESKLGAWASNQSAVIPDRNYLEEEYRKYREKFSTGKTIPRPPHWGGYLITPSMIEFWQGREARLHDRIEFRKVKDGWTRVRLAP